MVKPFGSYWAADTNLNSLPWLWNSKAHLRIFLKCQVALSVQDAPSVYFLWGCLYGRMRKDISIRASLNIHYVMQHSCSLDHVCKHCTALWAYTPAVLYPVLQARTGIKPMGDNTATQNTAGPRSHTAKSFLLISYVGCHTDQIE